MELAQLKNPKSSIYCERYVNSFKRVANEVSPNYCAVNGPPFFFLPSLNLPLKSVKLFFANPSLNVKKKVLSRSKVKFFVHPEMLSELEDKELERLNWEYKVEPTSSTRTVKILDENLMIKLHLNKRLSRFIRRLRPNSVEHSLLVSSELEASLKNCPKTFGYLPESIGVVYKKFGMIIRESNPRPLSNEKSFLIPLFSLYGRDSKDKSQQSLFAQLIKLNKTDPLDFLVKSIIKPLFSNMAFFINERGILLETHGQNVLIELNDRFEIKRLVHRDFQSIYIDNKIRKIKHLPLKFRKHIMDDESPRKVSYSVVYDQYLGKYVLDNFANLIKSEWGISEIRIKEKIKKVFLEYFDKALFPKKGFFLMGKRTFKDNKATFRKYAARPSYRP